MTIPNQRKEDETPQERILLKVSNDPRTALSMVVVDELNRMHSRVIDLEEKVASLEKVIRSMSSNQL